MDWYYVKDGEATGPLSERELEQLARRGELVPDDLVWNASMGEAWQPAAEATSFFDAPPDVMPPVSVTRRDEGPPPPVSVAEPARHAWAGMKLILFQPFDIKKWFALGFSAWLATLGEGGGYSGSSSSSSSGSSGSGEVDAGAELEALRASVVDFFQQFGPFIIAAVVIVAVVLIVLGLLTMWLRSRGKFMLLENVIYNRTAINEPWQRLAKPANSLFRWMIGYSVVCVLVGFVLLAIAWPTVIAPCLAAGALVSAAIPGVILLSVLGLLLGIVSYYVMVFLEDFVIPLMYCHREGAVAAWRRFGKLFGKNVGRFLRYGLFRMLLNLCAVFLILAAVVATCCVAGFLMVIPYVGAVVLLPVSVFFRLYGIEYLDQYGPEYWDPKAPEAYSP